MQTHQKVKLAKAASTRCWAILLLHILCAPVGSAVYSAKQNNWWPFATATAIAIVGFPLAVVDFGITAFFLAPNVSVFMLVDKALSSRRRLKVSGPEEAEAVLWRAIEKRAQELEG